MHNLKYLFSVFVFIFSLFLHAQDLDWELAFQDDFQEGFGSQWIFQGEWLVEEEDGNFFLQGTNHQFVECRDGAHWYNYKMECQLHIDSGTVHLNNRMSDNGRFFTGIAVEPEMSFMYVRQTDAEGVTETLFEDEVSFSERQWHKVVITTIQDTIWVHIDDHQILKAENPLTSSFGTIAFESLEGSNVWVDDVKVFVEREVQYNAENPWIKTGGPIGGLGYDIRIHPEDKNIMLVTDNPSGVNKSYNGGETWETRNTGLTAGSKTGAPIFSLTIDPVDPSNVWCGTQNFKGIYKSTDQGETWTKKDNGIVDDGISFRGFAIHPENSDIVYAAAEIATERDGIEFNMTQGRVYRTLDGGENWSTVWSGDNMARVLLFDYLHPDTIYCSTGLFDREAYNEDIEAGVPGGEGILKSTDGGNTWVNINNGLDNLYCGNLAMHPQNPEILFTATGNNAWSYPPNNQQGGVFRTTNGGQLWEKVLGDNLENNELFAFVAFSPSDPNIVYAGSYGAIHRSEDGGDTWVRMAKDESGYGPDGVNAGFPISAVVDPNDPYKIFVNNYGGGNFVSEDGGLNWKNASVGYTGAEIHALAVSKTNPAKVYTNAKSGAFVSLTAGDSWQGMQYGDAGGAAFIVAVNPENDQTVYVTNEHDGNIFKSTNGGYDWTLVFDHPDSHSDQVADRQGYKSIVYAPSDTTIVYAGCIMASSLNDSYYDVQGLGLAKSTDGGDTWSVFNGDLPTDAWHIADIAVSYQDPNTLYVGTFFDGIYKSENGGLNWTYLNNGLTSFDIRSLAIDPNNDDILYVGTASGEGIYKTLDGGANFEVANDGLHLKSASMIPSKRVMHNLQGKISGSSLGAKPAEYASNSWSKITDMVIDPTNTDVIYVADFVSGVYRSDDGGATWSALNEGFPNKNVLCLDISSDGEVLYMGSYEAGVFRYVIPNKAPVIIAAVPSKDEKITMYKDETINVEVEAFDFNKDSIQYQWYMDDVLLAGDELPSIELSGIDFALGEHILKVQISDSINTSYGEWDVDILDNTTWLDNTNGFSLLSVQPNPANLATPIEIHYALTSESVVNLSILDLSGRMISCLENSEKPAGSYQLTCNVRGRSGMALSAGTYIIKLTTNDISRSTKLVIQ